MGLKRRHSLHSSVTCPNFILQIGQAKNMHSILISCSCFNKEKSIMSYIWWDLFSSPAFPETKLLFWASMKTNFDPPWKSHNVYEFYTRLVGHIQNYNQVKWKQMTLSLGVFLERKKGTWLKCEMLVMSILQAIFLCLS